MNRELLNLPPIRIIRKSGQEPLVYNETSQLSASVLDFWQWSSSDLLSNVTRGVLAEYIVALSLGVNKKLRQEWDAWDLTYKGIKIEIKSSAYLQSWKQNDYSKIVFHLLAGARPLQGDVPESVGFLRK